MNDLTVADELAYEALPDEVKAIAERYWKNKIGVQSKLMKKGMTSDIVLVTRKEAKTLIDLGVKSKMY